MARYLVSLVNKRDGVKAETGNKYSIPRAFVLVPFHEASTANWNLTGIGTTQVELVVAESFYPTLENKFKLDFKGSPILYDFEVSLDRDGKNVLVGFEKSTTPPATFNKPAA
jgi:hypothetical protein